ncbi:MAG: winged helix-turn-helix domain-containing protein [Bacteroidota bacterium]
MSKSKIIIYSSLFILVFILWISSDSWNMEEDASGVAKIALREIGHKLLLADQDSTSLVLPVIKIEESKYKLSFQIQLSIEPDSLVSIVKQSFQKTNLSEYYIVEVIRCSDKEIAYSFKMRNEEEKSIIPCRGRLLPKSCYIIETRFIEKTRFIFNKNILLFFLGLISVIFLLDLLNKKKKQIPNSESKPQNHFIIGSFIFYSEQNKLVSDTKEISLSQKECELLTIFVTNPNQVIRRDELTKRVWEDNGVIVGRSLDTYISKLRKKFKDDNSTKITNIHGVGYKLEINQ